MCSEADSESDKRRFVALSILLSRRVLRLINTPVLHINLAVTKKTVGDGEKLITYLNSESNVLLGTYIFFRVPKKY
jgi:hypothetical protein